MYDLIQQRLELIETLEEKVHNLRECLHIIILRIMQESNQFNYMAFVGGTCLRILYHLKRSSEDLDFSSTIFPTIEKMSEALEHQRKV